MATDTLYDTDIFAWSQQQAKALRDLARTRPDLPNELDITNIAEEVEDVGKTALRAVQSALRLIFIHLLKIASDRDARTHAHWRGEIGTFHSALLDNYSASMRQQLDLDAIWLQARNKARLALADYDKTLAVGLPEACPFDLDELLLPEIAPDSLVARLETQHQRDDASPHGIS